jgi:hypothetical protein
MEHPDRPISFWRVPAPEFKGELDQWKYKGKKLHMQTIETLSSQGRIVIDADPYSVVFQENTSEASKTT